MAMNLNEEFDKELHRDYEVPCMRNEGEISMQLQTSKARIGLHRSWGRLCVHRHRGRPEVVRKRSGGCIRNKNEDVGPG